MIKVQISFDRRQIGMLYSYTGGDYVGSGSSLSLAPTTTLYTNAAKISTGNVTGGAQAFFVSNGELAIDGNISIPGGYAYMYGNSLTSTSNATVNAYRVTYAPTENLHITVAEGDGTAFSGFVVSENLLNRTTAQTVQIGNGGSAGISLQGAIDLSAASIGMLYYLTGGHYLGTGQSVTLGTANSLYVQANTINTGNVTGGSLAAFVAAGTLTVDGDVNSTNVVLVGDPVIFSPISFVDSTRLAVSQHLELAEISKAKIWRMGFGQFALQKDGTFRFDNGELLIEASQAIKIDCGDCLLKVSKGSIVLLKKSSRGQFSVKVLHDETKSSVQLLKAGATLNITSGEELVVGTPEDNLARRYTQSVHLGEETALKSELSFLSIVESSALLRGIIKNRDNTSLRATRKILHTTTCLTVATRNHGNYCK